MNVFFLDKSPKLAAQMHCDKHCIKMVLESAQLLSTAHRILDGFIVKELSEGGMRLKRWKLKDSVADSLLYVTSHANHPSAIWCRQNSSNYEWLANLAKELCVEYTYRYSRIHETESLIDWLLVNKPKNIKIGEFVEPPQAMPDNVKVPGDSVKAYRNYYLNDKKSLLVWGGKTKLREKPHWVSNE